MPQFPMTSAVHFTVTNLRRKQQKQNNNNKATTTATKQQQNNNDNKYSQIVTNNAKLWLHV